MVVSTELLLLESSRSVVRLGWDREQFKERFPNLLELYDITLSITEKLRLTPDREILAPKSSDFPYPESFVFLVQNDNLGGPDDIFKDWPGFGIRAVAYFNHARGCYDLRVGRHDDMDPRRERARYDHVLSFFPYLPVGNRIVLAEDLADDIRPLVEEAVELKEQYFPSHLTSYKDLPYYLK